MQTYTEQEWLVPNSWEPQWTNIEDGVVLNDNPSAWQQAQASDAIALQAPFGDGNSGWQNPCDAHSVPISANSGGVLAILTQNPKRNFLLLQNNSTATNAGDTAPDFYFGFGQVPQIGQGLKLSPGQGVAFDMVVPRNAIYLTQGPISNGFGSVLAMGVVVEGALAP
jgi:hypothetical protein